MGILMREEAARFNKYSCAARSVWKSGEIYLETYGA